VPAVRAERSVVGKIGAEGVVVAGGLHPDARTKYFRVGHMGACRASDVLATVGAVERAFAASGHARRAVAAAAEALR
jgi:alanine-glyoxylate transaminase/serine-glyoxylate transaminase/serine-pyruvate transaminase